VCPDVGGYVTKAVLRSTAEVCGDVPEVLKGKLWVQVGCEEAGEKYK